MVIISLENGAGWGGGWMRNGRRRSVFTFLIWRRGNRRRAPQEGSGVSTGCWEKGGEDEFVVATAGLFSFFPPSL